MKKRQWLIIGGVIIAIGWLTLTIITYRKGSETKPLTEAKLPLETIEFLKKVSDWVHIGIEWVEKIRIEDFNNDHDPERTKTGVLKKLEDENFIIYYLDQDNQYQRAVKALAIANNNILPLKSLFGVYYYPALVHNRKLPIYLAVGQEHYNEIVKSMGMPPAMGTAGITIFQFSSSGEKLCKCIAINFYVDEHAVNELTTVLSHELAHYVHLYSLDYLKRTHGAFNWEVEGIASYYSRHCSVPSKDADDYSLDQDCENYLDSYWVGFDFFKFIENRFRLGSVKNYLLKARTSEAIPVINEMSQMNFNDFQNEWRDYCRSNPIGL